MYSYVRIDRLVAPGNIENVEITILVVTTYLGSHWPALVITMIIVKTSLNSVCL
jgi:hypothetical protein